MYSTKVNQKSNKRMTVKLQRVMMLIAAIMMALVTFAACDEDENDGGGDENSNGGVSGKRFISAEFTCSKPLTQSFVRSELTYNSDGTLNRWSQYDASSKRVSYSDYSNNFDGTVAKSVTYDEGGNVLIESNYFYNSNKTLQKVESDYNNGYTLLTEYTYENGKKIREVCYMDGVEIYNYASNYNNNGRRTTTILTSYTEAGVLTMTYTRTYNSDGTVQKVTYPLSYVDNTPVTETFTWENKKTNSSFDEFFPF